LFLLLLTACMASGGNAAEQVAADIRIEDGPLLGAPRATHQLVSTGKGQLLAIGGCVRAGCEAGPASSTVDIIDTATMELAGTGHLLAARIQPSAASLPDGRILILGGWVDGRVSATSEIFDPATAKSSPGPALMGPRSGAVVTSLSDGRVLIAGGYDGQEARADVEIFDPASGRMTPVGSLITARGGASGTLLADGRVLIVGGSDERDYGGKLRSIERYDIASDRFVAAGSLSSARFKLADGLLLLPGNRVLVAAGDTAPEIFDVASGTATRVDYDLGGQWNYMTLVRADARTALLAGGYREGRIEPTDRSWIIRLNEGAAS
jgi:hypothetical protein